MLTVKDVIKKLGITRDTDIMFRLSYPGDPQYKIDPSGILFGYARYNEDLDELISLDGDNHYLINDRVFKYENTKDMLILYLVTEWENEA